MGLLGSSDFRQLTEAFWKKRTAASLTYGIIYGIFITKAYDQDPKVIRGLGCCVDVLPSSNKRLVDMKKCALKRCFFCSSKYTNQVFFFF